MFGRSILSRASPPSRELSSYSWLAFACGGTTPFTTALFRDYAPRRATRVCAVAMIVFGCAVTDGDKYRRFAETGIRRAAEPDSALLLRHGAPSIQTAYNSLLQEAGARPDLEALVLLHQDAELLERDLAEKLRICMGDPLVAVVGVAGSHDVHSLEWWGGSGGVGGVVMPEITGSGRVVGGTPPRGWPVDSVDGLLLALSPWAVRMLRFDESFAPYFHGYDVDVCFQARERGRRVVVADVNVAHHAGLDFFDRQSWVPAYILWHRKWGVPRERPETPTSDAR